MPGFKIALSGEPGAQSTGCSSRMPLNFEVQRKKINQRKGIEMDSTQLIRIAAGVLAVIVLVILIQRRRTRVK